MRRRSASRRAATPSSAMMSSGNSNRHSPINVTRRSVGPAPVSWSASFRGSPVIGWSSVFEGFALKLSQEFHVANFRVHLQFLDQRQVVEQRIGVRLAESSSGDEAEQTYQQQA